MAGGNPDQLAAVQTLYELDAEPSPEDAAILQSLMNAGDADRLEFLGLAAAEVAASRVEARTSSKSAQKMPGQKCERGESNPHALSGTGS